jgi:hypothetical protein
MLLKFQVHDMMDDIAEQQDVAREISEAISNPVAFGQDFDEDELEAELNELEAETDLAEQVSMLRHLKPTIKFGILSFSLKYYLTY